MEPDTYTTNWGENPNKTAPSVAQLKVTVNQLLQLYWTAGVLISEGARIVFLFTTGVQPPSCPMGTGGLFPSK